MNILEYIDPKRGENDNKSNLIWLNILAFLMGITVLGISYFGIMFSACIAGISISALITLKIIFNNRKNILNLAINLIKNSYILRAIKKSMSIEVVLYNAITREPPDLNVIEIYLNGKHPIWKRLFGYRKLEINKKFLFEEKSITMLHLAAQKGKRTVVYFLLEKGADKNIKTDDGKTPLNLAILNGNVNCIEAFNDIVDKDVLLFTAKEGNQECIEKVLEIIKNKENKEFKDIVNGYKDEYKNTLLHIAARSLNIDGVNVFLKYGADPIAMNINNEIPIVQVCNAVDSLKKWKVLCILLKQTSLFSLSPDIENIVNIKDKARKIFLEKFNESKKMEFALQSIINILMKNVQDNLAKIAVIGSGGSGKSSLINAIIGETKAGTSSIFDETKCPQGYFFNQKLVVDYPGYGTSSYSYNDFKKHFQCKEFDLIILAIKSIPDDKTSYCIKKVLKENSFNNLIFVQTFLDTILCGGDKLQIKKDKEDSIKNIIQCIEKGIKKIFESELKKAKTIEDIEIDKIVTKRLEEYKVSVGIDIKENDKVFFVVAKTPKLARKNPGFEKLEKFINDYCSLENLKKIRLGKIDDILIYIKEELIKNSNCPKIIESEWNMAMAAIGHYSESVNKAINEYIKDSQYVFLNTRGMGGETLHESKESKDINENSFIGLKNTLMVLHQRLTAKLDNKTFLMTLLYSQPKDSFLLKSIATIITLIPPLDMDLADENGRTLLMYASNDVNILISMVQRNRYLDHIDSKKYIEILNMKDFEGKTALMYAEKTGNESVVKFIKDQTDNLRDVKIKSQELVTM